MKTYRACITTANLSYDCYVTIEEATSLSDAARDIFGSMAEYLTFDRYSYNGRCANGVVCIKKSEVIGVEIWRESDDV